jgi:hypothetical protein
VSVVVGAGIWDKKVWVIHTTVGVPEIVVMELENTVTVVSSSVGGIEPGTEMIEVSNTRLDGRTMDTLVAVGAWLEFLSGVVV